VSVVLAFSFLFDGRTFFLVHFFLACVDCLQVSCYHCHSCDRNLICWLVYDIDFPLPLLEAEVVTGDGSSCSLACMLLLKAMNMWFITNMQTIQNSCFQSYSELLRSLLESTNFQLLTSCVNNHGYPMEDA